MSLDLVPFSEMIALGLGLASVGAAMIVQCAESKRKRATAPKVEKSGKSKKTVKSTKSLKSQRSSQAAQLKSKRSSRSQHSSQAAPVKSKSKRSLRSQGKKDASARSAGKKSLRSQKKADGSSKRSADAPQKVTGRSKREQDPNLKSSASVAPTKTAAEKTERSKRGAPTSLREVTAHSGRDTELSLKSLRKTQRTQRSVVQNQVQEESIQATQLLQLEPRELQMEPGELHFDKIGGLLKVQLHNPSNVRQAVKVKCSDNNLYRVNPIYFYTEPGQTSNVEVVRQGGTSKLDKIVFVTVKAPDTNKDLKQLFKETTREEQQMKVLPLWA